MTKNTEGQIPLKMPLTEGRVLRGIDGFYTVQTGSGEMVECRPKGLFRHQGIKPLPGDLVGLRQEAGQFVLDEIRERRNSLVRPPMSNLDQLFIVISTVDPAPNYLVIDRMTALAIDRGITPVLVFTKEDLSAADELRTVYGTSGIRILCSGCEADFAELMRMLSGKLSAFSGNSGVGKTTLLNRILPGIKKETGETSKRLGRGRHTTREVELFPVCGGYIADTPGFSALEIMRSNRIAGDRLQVCFPEFLPYIGKCRFTGCSHRTETGCAVRAAVGDGGISRKRYEDYLTLYDEACRIKEWQSE